MTERKCDTCHFFTEGMYIEDELEPGKTGWCHRHPPVFVRRLSRLAGMYDSRSEWPQVSSQDFCGEWVIWPEDGA